MLQRRADLVQTFAQAGTGEGIHLKARAETAFAEDLASFQVNRQPVESGGLPGQQLRDFMCSQRHGQQPIFQAIIGEDIGK